MAEKNKSLHNPKDSELLGAHVQDLRARFGSLVSPQGSPNRHRFKYRSVMGGGTSLFPTAESLANAFQIYMNWADSNPQTKQEKAIIAYALETIDVELGRPYSIQEFAQVMGMSINYLYKIKSDLIARRDKGQASADDLEKLEVFDWMHTCVQAQNYSGAMVNKFNPMFTAKMHGLNDFEEKGNLAKAGVQISISVRDQQTANDLDELDKQLQ